MRRFTKSFSVAELASKDGAPVPSEYYANARAVCKRAQKLRDLVGVPLIVRSGYRTPQHNRAVGGASHSRHLTASALDLSCYEWTAEQLAALYEGLIRLGVVPDGGLGVYPGANFIHIDIGSARRWKE